MNALTIRDTRLSITNLLCALVGLALLSLGTVSALMDFGHPRFIGNLALFGGLCGLLIFAVSIYKRCRNRRQIFGLTFLYTILGSLIPILILAGIIAGVND